MLKTLQIELWLEPGQAMAPQRGREGGQKSQNLFSKKMTKGEEGDQRIVKMSRCCLWMAPK